MSFSARGSPDSVQRRRLEMPQCFSTERVKARSFSMFCWTRLAVSSSRDSSSFEGWLRRSRECRGRSRRGCGRSVRRSRGRSWGRSRRCGRGWARGARWCRGRRGWARGPRGASAFRTRRRCRRGAVRWLRRRRFRGVRRRRRRLRALVVDVNALVDGGLGPVDGIGAGGGDAGELGLGAAFAGDGDELTEHADERVGEGLETEVREPKAEVELIGHEVNCMCGEATVECGSAFGMRR